MIHFVLEHKPLFMIECIYAIVQKCYGNVLHSTILVVTNEGRGGGTLTGRRSKLPAPRPSTEGLSLWNLLTKNIGKDLSQVSMPVALNEPLNMLQVIFFF